MIELQVLSIIEIVCLNHLHSNRPSSATEEKRVQREQGRTLGKSLWDASARDRI